MSIPSLLHSVICHLLAIKNMIRWSQAGHKNRICINCKNQPRLITLWDPLPATAASLRTLSKLGQPAQPMYLRRLFQWLGLTGSWQVATATGHSEHFLSCPRPRTGGSQPLFTVKPPPHTSRASTDSGQLHIAL